MNQNLDGHSPKWWKKHPSARAKAEAVRASQAAMNTQPPNTQSNRLIYLRTIGFPAFCLAIAAVVMEVSFPMFVAFCYLALATAIVDSVLDVELGRFRYAMAGFLFVFALWFTFGFVIGTTKPTITSTWFAGNYAAGTDIDGLSWNDSWSELRLGIRDDSDEDLKDVDIELRPDGWMAEAKVVGDLCILAPGPTIAIMGTDQRGNQYRFSKGLSNHSYHLMCAKIPAHMDVWVVIALTNEDSRVIEKRKPDWITLRGKYKVKIRPYTLDIKVVPVDNDPLFMQKK
jgi:hypothetical protein